MIRRYATDVIAVGQAVLDANPTILSNRSTATVFYSAVATEGLEHLLVDADESNSRVVQIGRVDPEKNQLLGIEVFSEALERGVPAELWIVGRPTEGYVDEVEQRVADLGLADSVRLCGLRSDVMTFVLPTSVALLHTSTTEGLPGVLLEALAVGTPVVASDIAPHREVARHLDGITLVGLDQPVSAWADALVPLIAAPPTGSERRARLREFRASEFALEQHIPRLLALWGAVESN
jgi:glycosyltransferase involved in cell wall biosynthesis